MATAEQWQQVQDLFHAALEKEPAERSVFLEHACGGNESLRHEVAWLISAHETEDHFIDLPGYVAARDVLADHHFEPGEVLAHYKIQTALGSGGMGEVYLSEDTKLNRKVALKLLPPHFTINPDRVRRFEREARAASALNHPNIVTIYEIGQSDSAHFIATEFVEGKTLRQLINEKPFTLNETLNVSLQVAEALSGAHAAGIVHRDIKPENIMIRRDGYVKILDFGLAKLTEQQTNESDLETPTLLQTNPGLVMGTAGYMSPEQARGQKVDARSDIFSLGVVLYEMITGRAPFEGDSQSDVIAAILKTEPSPLGKYLPEAPRELERIVTKALRKDREERYQVVKDLLLDLKSLKREFDPGVKPERASGAVAPARTTSSAEYLIGQIKRHKRGALLGLAILVLIVAGLVLGLSQFLGQHQPPGRASGPATRVVPFTTFPGSELSPTFSPDGNQIAFAWDGEKGDNFDIYVKLIDAGGPVRLTTNPAADLSPAWSPDGRYIAFSRVTKSELGIFIIPALGGPERKLSTASPISQAAAVDIRDSAMDLALQLSWSPDGKFLAFSAQETPQEPSSIFLLSLETLEKRKLMPPPPGSYWGDLHPAFSPDGMTLAFTREAVSGIHDLYLVPAVGGEPRRLTFDNQRISCLTWTPDGREIIFSSNSGGGNSLWRIPASGGTPERLAAGGENGQSPALSRQGNRLAYGQSIGDLDIWRIELPNPAGKEPTKFISSTRAEFHQQFSPDGKRIAFQSNRSGTHEIWVCDSEGLNCTQLTFFGGPPAGSPRWSPDSQRIAFDCILAGNKDIYVVSVEGGTPRRLTTEPSDEVRPSWSRDGRWIYFGSNRAGTWQVWKAPAEGGQAVSVTKQGGREAFESPDGKFVYYIKGFGLSSIWRVPVEGGEEIQILDHVVQGSWAVLDRGIYFVNTRTTPRQAIEFFNFATGQATRIVTLEKQAGGGLTISPDGRWLLYTQVEPGGSDIMLIENFR
jgi:eukaryotic-like serine/threonine-protein kinase